MYFHGHIYCKRTAINQMEKALSFASNAGLENPLIRTINTRRIWSVCDAFCGLAFKQTATHGILIKHIPNGNGSIK